jgi:hypothetical protein
MAPPPELAVIVRQDQNDIGARGAPRARPLLLAHVCAFLRVSAYNPMKTQGRVPVFEKV